MYKLLKGNARDFSATIAKYPQSEIVGFHTSDDLSLFSCLVWTEGEVIADDVREVIKEVEVEVIKEIIKEVDNPEHLKTIAALEKENKTLKSQNSKLQSKINKLIEE